MQHESTEEQRVTSDLFNMRSKRQRKQKDRNSLKRKRDNNEHDLDDTPELQECVDSTVGKKCGVHKRWDITLHSCKHIKAEQIPEALLEWDSRKLLALRTIVRH